MPWTSIRHARSICVAVMLAALAACQNPGAVSEHSFGVEQRFPTPEARMQVLNRVSWGASASSMRHVEAVGIDRYMDEQLRPPTAVLPPAVQAQIDAMTISQQRLDELLVELDKRRRGFLAIG